MEIGVRWTVGSRSGMVPNDAVAELQAVTRDGVVLGVVLGTALAAAELDGWRPYRELAELYRSAGGDEQVAAAELAWRRDHGRAAARADGCRRPGTAGRRSE